MEYKRGKPKSDHCDTVQLCAQALCLGEMLGQPVPAGALFYGRTRRRLAVAMDAALRQTTREACLDLHAFIQAGRTPEAVHDSRCAACSMEGACLPRACSGKRSVRAYLQHALETP